MAEKMRVHILAKELNVASKVILEKCRAEGLGDVVKNHMSTLSAGLDATIREWFSVGAHVTAVETAARIDLKHVTKKTRRKTKRKQAAADDGAGDVAVAVDPSVAAPAGPADTSAAAATPAPADEAVVAKDAAASPDAVPAGPVAAPVDDVTEKEGAAAGAEPAVADAGVAAPGVGVPGVAEPDVAAAGARAPVAAESGSVDTDAASAGEGAPATAEPATAEPAVGPTRAVAAASDEAVAGVAPGGGLDSVSEAPDAGAGVDEKGDESAEMPRPVPAGPQNVPAPAKLQGPRIVRYEAPDYEVVGPRRPPSRPPSPGPTLDRPPEAPARGRGGGRAAARRSRINPRRAAGRAVDAGQRLAEWRDRDLAERRERLAGATGRRIRRQRSAQTGGPAHVGPAGPKTEATVSEPVRLKEFCAVTGLNFLQLFKVLKDEHSMLANINMTLATETAQLLALHFGIDLKVLPAKTKLDEISERFAARERKHCVPRPPVVAMLGHVDHGKTSLLDAIRKSRVAAGEDGGITQHIGAYHLTTSHGAVTFLDTPGHQAFTAMRARGAQLTDVVVLVVASDDGVMPQTIEAINHAQSADVAIVVALTKSDLGDDNKLKVFGQLAEHGLSPSEWGGEVDVIPTSVVSGTGIDELVEHLAAMSELLELNADPTLPAMGAVIEAEIKPGVGAVAQVLIQDGTLHVGDAVVCGNAFGKVRALSDDRGRRIQEAGPAMPVEVWGLDDVPIAGDRLYCVDALKAASDIASEVKQKRIAQSRQASRKVRTLEDIFKQRDADELPELNVIVKADVDGSLAVLRQTLSEWSGDEVRLTLRHAGVGAVNDSDVLLAATSNAIVIAFRVETPAGSRRLAEQHGVDIRSYRVIYDVNNDIRRALEGLLAPDEHVEFRATAEVRNVFHISKLGVVAGCYVTNGTVDRNHLVKVVRDGVIVREGCRIGSLRRFKDDAKTVRNGLECGIRLEGFDDVHAGDVIETYDVVKVARTLSAAKAT
ncbi:MAG: translation initiation factor IF-2 [Phycisphaerae bacterium]